MSSTSALHHGTQATFLRRNQGTLILAVALILFTWLAFWFWEPIFDDAYISMRYAQNWADGNGLVFNAGERVEGFSDPLWVFILAGFTKLGLPIVDMARLLGGLSAAAVIIICATRQGPAPYHAWGGRIAALLLAASGEFLYYAFAGLETILFSLILLVTALLWEPHPSRRKSFLLALLALLAALTRPEGALLIVIVLGSNALLNWKNYRDWLWPAALTALAVGLLLWARWSYFGALLPNTFLAKPFVANWLYIKSSLRLIHGYFLQDGRYILLLFALGAAILQRKTPPTLPLVALTGMGLFFMGWSGGHPRFFTPYLPIVYLLAGNLMAAVMLRGKIWRTGILAFTLFLVGLSLYFAAERASVLREGGRDPSGHSRGHVAVGRWLAEHTAPDASILAWEIGAIGFYADRRILDTQGLVDREVATFYSENNHNPYIYWIEPAKTRALSNQVIQLLLARGADYALLEYHGDLNAPVDPGLIIPQDAYKAVVEERGFILIKRFILDDKLPKSFLLYQAPDLGSSDQN